MAFLYSFFSLLFSLTTSLNCFYDFLCCCVSTFLPKQTPQETQRWRTKFAPSLIENIFSLWFVFLYFFDWLINDTHQMSLYHRCCDSHICFYINYSTSHRYMQLYRLFYDFLYIYINLYILFVFNKKIYFFIVVLSFPLTNKLIE